MEKVLGLVHTTRLVVERSHVAITKGLPDYKPVHLLDESLLMDFAQTGGVNARARRKLLAMVRSAEEVGAVMVLVTCSSLGDAVYEVQRFVDIPVLKIDEPMAEEVVRSAHTIGILATAPSAVAGTCDLVNRAATRTGREIELRSFICADAGAYLARGMEDFNRYLAEEAGKACRDVDALIVAQLSMCGLEDFIDGDIAGKTYTSLPYAVRKMRAMLD
jgi:hypothetical protein